MGGVTYSSEGVMAVSSPLKSQGNTVGVLRFITSLKAVNKDVKTVSGVFVIIGMLVAAAAAFISILLSNTIVEPLKEITGVAEKMATGMFAVRSRKAYNDEIGKLSDTLNYMADEIQNKDRLKNDFISSVSHELRTPLTSIKGWAVTLMEGNPEDREMLRDGLGIIEKESDRLSSMVEELLDFSRFVTGKVTINKGIINLNNFVSQIYKQLFPRAKREGIAFTLGILCDIPEISTDENRMKQVFINILDNSFKFTEPGGSVGFTVECSDRNVVFRVRDTGCGIPKDELPQIKEKFYKGRNSKSGNGIGLSICDEIIKLMSGSFEIESEPGLGTEVIITLPLDVE
jgi:signal transduction histidine kinase